MNKIVNAKIASTSLGFDHHYSFWIHINYGSSAAQSFGGYQLGGEFTDYVIRNILETVGVDQWEELKGTPIRVEQDNGGIYRIGHFLEDKWFDPKEFNEVKL